MIFLEAEKCEALLNESGGVPVSHQLSMFVHSHYTVHGGRNYKKEGR